MKGGVVDCFGTDVPRNDGRMSLREKRGNPGKVKIQKSKCKMTEGKSSQQSAVSSQLMTEG